MTYGCFQCRKYSYIPLFEAAAVKYLFSPRLDAILKGPAHAATSSLVRNVLLEIELNCWKQHSLLGRSHGAASLPDGLALLQQFAHRKTNSAHLRKFNNLTLI